MRFLEGRAIRDRRRIEHHDVGKHSFLEQAAVIESQVGRGQAAQPANRFASTR